MKKENLIKQIIDDERYIMGNKRKYRNMNYYHVIERQKRNTLKLLLIELEDKEKYERVNND
jgi:hypothetical protein